MNTEYVLEKIALSIKDSHLIDALLNRIKATKLKRGLDKSNVVDNVIRDTMPQLNSMEDMLITQVNRLRDAPGGAFSTPEKERLFIEKANDYDVLTTFKRDVNPVDPERNDFFINLIRKRARQ